MKNPLGTKLYYSISEVAELTGLQPYTLRAWEKEFACLRPKRARGKNRAYRERDIGIVLLIKRLLYQERYTTQGVKQKLKNEPDLLRQVATQLSILLAKGPAKEKRETVAEEPVKPREKHPDVHKNVPVTPTSKERTVERNLQLQEVIIGIKRELKDLLQLL